MNEPSYSDHPSIESMESLDSHSTDSCVHMNVLPPEQDIVTHSEGQSDLGVIIKEVNGSWDKLRSVVNKLPRPSEKTLSLKSLQTSPWSFSPLSPSNKKWQDMECFLSIALDRALSLVVIQQCTFRWHLQALHPFSRETR